MLQLKHIDHIELYVGNSVQAAYFYSSALGFQTIAHAGLTTGMRDRESFVVAQGNVRLVLSSGLSVESTIANHVLAHGDSVRDIAFTVENAEHAFDVAVRNGARVVAEPQYQEDEYGQIVRATVGAFNDTVHSFIQRDSYGGAFLPGYEPVLPALPTATTGIVDIDHVALGVEQHRLDEVVDFYQRVLSFHELHEEMVTTEHTAMNSKVVESGSHTIKIPIVEPAPSLTGRRSQIDEYLAYHNGAGAQHIAFLTQDIVSTARQMKANGVGFLHTPDTYYEMMERRVGRLDAGLLGALQELGILVDTDQWGMLLQLFSKPLQSRPTLFMELIQRRGARGFGAGNIKALFEAIEREQARRGNI